MGEVTKALFIINPYSGRKKYSELEEIISQSCKDASVECSIIKTERAGHATEIAKEAADQNFDRVFAVGGDGTVNEVARGLIHTNVTMGIIPVGSGNGLARHLGIPLKISGALALLKSGRSVLIDALQVNGEISVNVSGIGFDGHIANMFGKTGRRGLQEYATLAATEFRKFKTFPAPLTIDDEQYNSDAFIIAFANSSQFGNNATISPDSSVCDGVVDVCIIKKVSLLQALGFAGKMFTRRMHKSAFVEIIKAKKVVVSFDNPMPFHVDGEGLGLCKEFKIEVIPSSLRVLANSDRI